MTCVATDIKHKWSFCKFFEDLKNPITQLQLREKPSNPLSRSCCTESIMLPKCMCYPVNLLTLGSCPNSILTVQNIMGDDILSLPISRKGSRGVAQSDWLVALIWNQQNLDRVWALGDLGSCPSRVLTVQAICSNSVCPDGSPHCK